MVTVGPSVGHDDHGKSAGDDLVAANGHSTIPAESRVRYPISTPQRPAAGTAAEPIPGTMASAGEFSVIDTVTAGISQPASTELGPGDDCAVIATPDGRVVASIDVLVDLSLIHI